jgi:ketopantoate reductase
VRLARAGNEVSAVARGPTLEAVRRDGLRLLAADEELHAAITVSDDGIQPARTPSSAASWSMAVCASSKSKSPTSCCR